MSKGSPNLRLLKHLLWLYLVLLIFEGALRKWVMPGLSTPLLVARDPVVVLIYMLAFANNRFVVNGFVIVDVFLIFTTFVAGVLSPYSNLMVTLIGLRCYFLQIPLIFVMEKTLDRDDVFRMGKFLLWVSLPITFLLVKQYYSPQSAWVNLDLGGVITNGMPGANGKFRPSATFSFTTGVSEFYPLVLALLLAFLLSRRKLPLYLSIAAGVAVVFAVPFSISRTNALSCAIVLLTGGLSVLFLPNPPRILARTILVAGVIAVIVSQLSFFNEGVSTFEARWVDSTGTDTEGFRTNIVDRALEGVTPDSGYIFDSDNLMGVGVGYGTNMASAFLSGQRGFVLGEDEWPRLLLEIGPMLGVVFIGLRIALCFRLVAASLAALRRNNAVPILITSACFLLVLNAQWAQPTTLGFAMFSAGLVLAAARVPGAPSAPARPRRRPSQQWNAGVRSTWQPLGTPEPGPVTPRPFAGSPS
ncbi:MAG: hypothetical protein ABSH19_00695 [Opitutales bacterium]|jgi:hypothetical protein